MNDAFEILLKEFAAARGMVADSSVFGLEFDCEGHTVNVVAHPLHDDQVLVEVSVATLPVDPPASTLALLLQINEAARFEHDWTLLMDPELTVSLSTRLAVAGLSVAALEALMLDGVTRAQAVADLLETIGGQDDARVQVDDAEATAPAPSMNLRA
ncbi:MAG: hypothetical protein RL322_402 [Pseudomonadota bacterium]|jgi:hypothetical protein